MKTNSKLIVPILLLCLALAACNGQATETPDWQAPTESPSALDAQPDEGMQAAPPAIVVAGWLGSVHSAAADSPYDDYLTLQPEGAGEFGLVGASAEIEAEIVGLRDKDEPGKYAHFWGTLSCGVEDHNGCQLVVERLRYGATATDPEPVDGWEGSLLTSTFNSGLSYVLELAGEYPVWFSLHSNDQAVLDQLEVLGSTQGTVIKVWGELLTGVPDVNGARIQVSQIVVLQEGSPADTPVATGIDPYEGWSTYVNERYGYTLRYPPTATITESGPVGFPSDELPDNMTIDEYFDALEELYGLNLCVQIHEGLGYLNVLGSVEAGLKYAVCGRTGVGAGELVDKSEPVMIAGQSYTANGFEFIGDGETLDQHNETMVVVVDGVVRFEYGSVPRGDATYEDYLMKGRDTLLLILASFEWLD